MIVSLSQLRSYLEAIRGLLRHDKVSESDKETDRKYAEQVAKDLEILITEKEDALEALKILEKYYETSAR